MVARTDERLQRNGCNERVQHTINAFGDTNMQKGTGQERQECQLLHTDRATAGKVNFEGKCLVIGIFAYFPSVDVGQ